MRSKRKCAEPFCPVVLEKGYRCALHAEKYDKFRRLGLNSDKDRAKPYVGGDTRWRKARLDFLATCPSCVDCGQLATTVDHIIPHGGNMRMFWNRSNWQPMCKRCHSIKTNKYDGGFGNRKR
jgi:5-methylcytosine-specific restriction enzyme A